MRKQQILLNSYIVQVIIYVFFIGCIQLTLTSCTANNSSNSSKSEEDPPTDPTTPPPVNDDIDGDGVKNDVDLCPNDADPKQEDMDNDNIGDACDVDIDGDTYSNEWEEMLFTDPRDPNDYPGVPEGLGELDDDNDCYSNVTEDFYDPSGTWKYKDTLYPEFEQGECCDMKDTDKDNYSDYVECMRGTNPNDEQSVPVYLSDTIDSDGDCYPDGVEDVLGFDYQDGDDHPDPAEVPPTMYECLRDKDNDCYSDGLEGSLGFRYDDRSNHPHPDEIPADIEGCTPENTGDSILGASGIPKEPGLLCEYYPFLDEDGECAQPKENWTTYACVMGTYFLEPEGTESGEILGDKFVSEYGSLSLGEDGQYERETLYDGVYTGEYKIANGYIYLKSQDVIDGTEICGEVYSLEVTRGCTKRGGQWYNPVSYNSMNDCESGYIHEINLKGVTIQSGVQMNETLKRDKSECTVKKWSIWKILAYTAAIAIILTPGGPLVLAKLAVETVASWSLAAVVTTAAGTFAWNATGVAIFAAVSGAGAALAYWRNNENEADKADKCN